VRPLSAEIKRTDTVGGRPLFSGQNKTFTCFAYGSYPPPKISWWIDDRFQIDTHIEVIEFGKPSEAKRTELLVLGELLNIKLILNHHTSSGLPASQLLLPNGQ
jgi:hypothetical protein